MTTTPVALPPRSPFGRFGFAALAATVAALFAATRAPATPPPLAALAGGLALGYLPGLGLALWVGNRRGFWASWILPLIVSPAVSTFLGFVLTGSGFPLERAAGGIVFVSMIAVLFAPPPAREIEEWSVSLDRPGSSRQPDRTQVLTLALAVMLAVGVPLLLVPALVGSGAPVREAAVAGEIERHGLPPGDPAFAGAPLAAPWAFEAYVALLRSATGLDTGAILAGGSLIAALCLVFTAYRLLLALGLTHLRAMWGVIFLLLGEHGLSWIGALAGVPHEWHGHAFFLARFLPAGASVLGLISLLVFVSAALASQGESRRIGLAAAGAVGAMLFNPELALAGFFAALLAVPVTWLAGRRFLPGAGWDLLAGVCVPVALALLITGPYLATLRGAGTWSDAPRLGVSGAVLGPLLAALLPALLFAVPVLARLLRAAEARRVAWAVWCILAVVEAVFVRVPGDRGAAFPFLLAVPPLALTAGVAVPGLWRAGGPRRKALCAAGVAAALLPATILGLAGALHAGTGADRDPTWREAANWIRDMSPPRAVIAAESPDLVPGAGRPFLMSPGPPPPAWSPERAALRRRAQDALLLGRPLDAEERAHLLALGVPVLVVRRGEAPGPEYHTLFRTDGVAIVGWTPSFPESPPS